MIETNHGLVVGARASADDEFLRLDYRVREQCDIGGELGAEPARKAAWTDARNTLIAGILVPAWGSWNRWLAYSRDRNRYARAERYLGPLGSYAAVMWAVETLAAAGLIDERRTRPSPSFRRCSQLRASTNLLLMTPITHVGQLEQINLELIRLKDAAKQLCSYRDTSQTRAWRSDIHAQNEALGSLSVELPSPGWQVDDHGLLRNGERVVNPICNQLYRVFNGGWLHGGRWYGGWWQQLAERDRERLLIDGRSVVELDYPFHHPTLLAALSGRSLEDADPYVINGFPRDEVKLTFNILVNADNKKKAILALHKQLREACRHHPRPYVVRLIEAVRQRHPQFERFWATGIGRRLQCIDGEMCAEIQRTMRGDGIPVLSVHDSFIAEQSQRGRLEEVMEDALTRVKRDIASGFLKY